MFMKSRKWLFISPVILLLLVWWFSLPRELFKQPHSTVLTDREGNLLNAQVASDGHWRFPHTDELPEKYRIALVQFEDRWFYFHPGFNPFSLVRTFYQNLKARKIKSGGSTITMQVVRLSRQGKPRNIPEKVIEIFLASRIEARYSKKDILLKYAANAPFGGNVVGLQAAAWRYFGHSQNDLTWAEAATLAILPNSPSLIFPGRNQETLLAKRNRLLHRLFEKGCFDNVTLQLALNEPLPGAPFPLPQLAPHLFTRAITDGLSGKTVQTTIDGALQQRIAAILVNHNKHLRGSHIHNIAALVADNNTGRVLAYWGNVPQADYTVNARQVDVINAKRSPGSLLKPFLFAGLLRDGMITPQSLVPDIPTHFQGFSPENFTRTFDGAVPADRALARSLNIPAVRMLMQYNPAKFLSLLKDCGVTTLEKPALHYGLSLILGGGEITMWEMAGAYASMARTLNHYGNGQQIPFETFFPLTYQQPGKAEINSKKDSPFTTGVIWSTFNAMIEAARPDTEANWSRFGANRRVAWKTGTSFGNRDAWAIGVTPQYVVAVWVGNATGEGRPAITGIGVAAPVLFDIFGTLPSGTWFSTPYEDLKRITVCSMSGLPASQYCNSIDTIYMPSVDIQTGVCHYHRVVHLHHKTGERVNLGCVPLSDIETTSWFVLPPTQEYYFRQKNPFYKPLPPIRIGCQEQGSSHFPMQWIYPTETTIIYVPLELDGKPGETIFKVAHNQENAILYWHLNDQYVGSTTQFHEMAFRPPPGKYRFIVTDHLGNIISKELEIRSRN